VAERYGELLNGQGMEDSDSGQWTVTEGSDCHSNEKLSLILPRVKPDRTSVWAQYSVRLKEGRRERVQAALKEAGIPTAVHYPMPLHLQECFAYLGYKKGDFPIAEKVSEEIVSLPMNPDLSNIEIDHIVEAVSEIV
jgi:UDP-2-acetamido-2-deoxy-ribo-hexuluronate aminotransferase